MKKVMILFMVLAICGITRAELLSGNRGFEYGDMTDWLQWASGSYWGWQSWYDTTTVINDGTAYEGDYYVELTQSAGWWGYNIIWQGESTIIPADPLETYTLSAYARSTDPCDTQAGLKMESLWYTPDPCDPCAMIEHKVGTEVMVDITTDWTLISMVYTPDPLAAELRACVLDKDGYTGGTFVTHFDAVSLVPEPMTIALFGLGSAFVLRRRKA